EYDLDGVSITAEAGWDQLISKGTTESGRTYEWRVEPHVRAYWSNLGSPEDYTTGLGETYSSSFDNGLLVRVGARTKLASTKGTGPAVQAYAEANWVYNNGDYSTTVSTRYGDATSTQEAPNFAELRLGFEAQFTPRVNMWVEGHHQTGSDDYESSGAMIGFKYRW
ncbi:autotransporter outer membrane beta-barrel domain-containing protein, partial [Sutterella massiliensis]